MTSPVTFQDHPPIYQGMVQDRGDVVAEARLLAEEIQRQAEKALDWSDVHRAHHRPI